MADPESDKENQHTPVPFNKKHRLPVNASLPSTILLVPPSSTVSPTFVLDPNSPLAANTPTLPFLRQSAIANAAASPAFILDPKSALVPTTQIRPPLPFRPTLIANNAITAPFPHIKQEPRHVMLSTFLVHDDNLILGHLRFQRPDRLRSSAPRDPSSGSTPATH